MKVTPIMGQPFCYRVQSRTRPIEHFVNWVDMGCTCEDFTMNRRSYLERTGDNYLCAHMEATMKQSWMEMLETYREQHLAL